MSRFNAVKRRLAPVCAVLSLLSLAVIASAGSVLNEDDKELLNLAEELVELRSDVETLSNDLELKKTEMRNSLRSLAARKADLEVQISKEKLRLKQIRQAIDKQKELSAKDEVAKDYLGPLVEKQIGRTRKYIESSLPFKTAARLEELDKVGDMLEKNTIEPEKALARTWSIMEDEFRLCGENGLYRQQIVLGGEEQLADVARIGMVMLYFKTSDDRVGMAVETGGGWEFKTTGSKEDKQRILYLFDSMEKRIREGYFELPAAKGGVSK